MDWTSSRVPPLGLIHKFEGRFRAYTNELTLGASIYTIRAHANVLRLPCHSEPLYEILILAN